MIAIKSFRHLIRIFVTGGAAIGGYLLYKCSEDVCVQNGLQYRVSGLFRWVALDVAWDLAAGSLAQYCRQLSQKSWFSSFRLTTTLVDLANSRNRFLHDLGTLLLSSLCLPDSTDMVRLRERCSWYTLVSLARLPQTDINKWFPFSDASSEDEIGLCGEDFKNHVDHLLHLLVSSLPKSADACSMRLYHQLIGKVLPDEPPVFLMQEFCEENMFASKLVHESPVDRIALSLDILRRYSQTLDIDSNIPESLLKILKAAMFLHRKDTKNLEICGSILANISACSKFHEQIVDGGFLPLLVQWRRGGCLPLGALADRILHNMDIMNSTACLSDGVHLLYPTYRQQDPNPLVDVIFVHGVWGSPFYTWRQSDSANKSVNADGSTYTYCWPKSWLPDDAPRLRILTLQYDSYVSSWYLPCPQEGQNQGMRQLALDIGQKLRRCGVGQRPIVWVTHSMGGLLVKQLLIEAMNELKTEDSPDRVDLGPLLLATQGITFYATPHLGSPIATTCNYVRFLLYPSLQASELMENSQLLKDMHSNFMHLLSIYDIECLSFCEERPTKLPYVKMKAHVVPRRSCDVGYGRAVLCHADHLDICKPMDKADLCYKATHELISKVLVRAAR